MGGSSIGAGQNLADFLRSEHFKNGSKNDISSLDFMPLSSVRDLLANASNKPTRFFDFDSGAELSRGEVESFSLSNDEDKGPMLIVETPLVKDAAMNSVATNYWRARFSSLTNTSFSETVVEEGYRMFLEMKRSVREGDPLEVEFQDIYWTARMSYLIEASSRELAVSEGKRIYADMENGEIPVNDAVSEVFLNIYWGKISDLVLGDEFTVEQARGIIKQSAPIPLSEGMIKNLKNRFGESFKSPGKAKYFRINLKAVRAYFSFMTKWHMNRDAAMNGEADNAKSKTENRWDWWARLVSFYGASAAGVASTDLYNYYSGTETPRQDQDLKLTNKAMVTALSGLRERITQVGQQISGVMVLTIQKRRSARRQISGHQILINQYLIAMVEDEERILSGGSVRKGEADRAMANALSKLREKIVELGRQISRSTGFNVEEQQRNQTEIYAAQGRILSQLARIAEVPSKSAGNQAMTSLNTDIIVRHDSIVQRLADWLSNLFGPDNTANGKFSEGWARYDMARLIEQTQGTPDRFPTLDEWLKQSNPETPNFNSRLIRELLDIGLVTLPEDWSTDFNSDMDRVERLYSGNATAADVISLSEGADHIKAKSVLLAGMAKSGYFNDALISLQRSNSGLDGQAVQILTGWGAQDRAMNVKEKPGFSAVLLISLMILKIISIPTASWVLSEHPAVIQKFSALVKVAAVEHGAKPAEAVADPLGGIDFNAANLNLEIKRDGKGVPLPMVQQNLEKINIDGLVPITM